MGGRGPLRLVSCIGHADAKPRQCAGATFGSEACKLRPAGDPGGSECAGVPPAVGGQPVLTSGANAVFRRVKEMMVVARRPA